MQTSGDCRHHSQGLREPRTSTGRGDAALTEDADGRRPSGCAPRGDEPCVIHVSDAQAPSRSFSGCRRERANCRAQGCLRNLGKTPSVVDPRAQPGPRAQSRQSASETAGWRRHCEPGFCSGLGREASLAKSTRGGRSTGSRDPTCRSPGIGRGRAPSRPAPQPIACVAPPGSRPSAHGPWGSVQSEYDSRAGNRCKEASQRANATGGRSRGRAPGSGAGSPPRS